jgi:hypothetical protein
MVPPSLEPVADKGVEDAGAEERSAGREKYKVKHVASPAMLSLGGGKDRAARR